jgi:nucleotide-binding universal stress UspA family protein
MAPIQLERILCPVDFSEFSVAAYAHASSVARQYGAKLFVQHVVEVWRHPSASFSVAVDLYDQFVRALVAKGEEELRVFLKNHAKNEIHPECVIHDGLAADRILSLADEQAMDLIVMGTHGRRGFDRLMLGSVTERVLRRARCPVLAVHQPPRSYVVSATAREVIELRHILLCTDFSDDSNRALDYALYLAAEHSCGLTLVHVLEGIPLPGRRKQATAKAKEALEKLAAAQAKKGCKITTTVRIGKPYKEIIRLAREKDADLVILAVRGRNAVDLAVFGSTTYRVIQLGTCPVLAVHL